MKVMTGEIGKFLLDDKLIGAFKYWTVLKQGDKTVVNTPMYWFYEKPPQKVTAEFYFDSNGNPKLVCSKEVEINLDPELNKKIKNTLSMNLGNSW